MEDLDDSGLLPLAVERGWITKDQATSGRPLRDLISAQQLAELRQERQLANRILQHGFLAPPRRKWPVPAAAFGFILLGGVIAVLAWPKRPVPVEKPPGEEHHRQAQEILKAGRSRENVLEALRHSILAVESQPSPESCSLLVRLCFHAMQGPPRRLLPVEAELAKFLDDARSRLGRAPDLARGIVDVARSFLICDKIEDSTFESKESLRKELRDSAREAVGFLEKAGGGWEPLLGLAIAHTLLGLYGGDAKGLRLGGEHLARAGRASPENPEILRWTGYYHYVKNEFSPATAAWERALKLDPALADELTPLIRRADK